MSFSLRSFVGGVGLAFGLALVGGPLIGTVTAAQPGGTKIATVDLESTLLTTPAGKKASAAFEKSRKDSAAKLEKKQEDLKKKATELEKQAGLLKPEVVQQRKGQLEKEFIELQQSVLKAERALAEERTKLIQDLLKKAAPFIEQIAKDEGVDIIIDQQAVVWSKPATDLTSKLHAKMK